MDLRRGVLAVAASGWATIGAAAGPARPDGFERSVLAAINAARAHPQQIAQALRRYADTFDGRVAHEDGDPVGVQTFEGRRAVDEAVAFLERQPPLPPLGFGPVLARAAQGWAATQGRAGGLGHGAGGDDSPGARVRAAGGDIFVGETISYGMDMPERVVRQFIVDDGEVRRGHRVLLFSPGYRFAGIGCGPHARFGTVCVVDYAGTADGRPVLPQLASAQPSRASAFSR